MAGGGRCGTLWLLHSCPDGRGPGNLEQEGQEGELLTDMKLFLRFKNTVLSCNLKLLMKLSFFFTTNWWSVVWKLWGTVPYKDASSIWSLTHNPCIKTFPSSIPLVVNGVGKWQGDGWKHQTGLSTIPWPWTLCLLGTSPTMSVFPAGCPCHDRTSVCLSLFVSASPSSVPSFCFLISLVSLFAQGLYWMSVPKWLPKPQVSWTFQV